VASRAPPLTRGACDTSDARSLTRQRARSPHPERISAGGRLLFGLHLLQPWRVSSFPTRHLVADKCAEAAACDNDASPASEPVGWLCKSFRDGVSSWPPGRVSCAQFVGGAMAREKCRADRATPTCFWPWNHIAEQTRRLSVSRQGSDMFLEPWTSRLGAIAGVSTLPCMMAASKHCGKSGLAVPAGCQNKLKSHHAGALGLNDDSGTTQSGGPSFLHCVPSRQERRRKRDMSCSARDPLRRLLG
jgi:hypothetical protein